MTKQFNSPQQWQFWVTRKRVNPDTGKPFTESEAKIHVSSFRKSSKYFWIKRGYTEKDAILKVKEHQAEMYSRARVKNKGKKDLLPNQKEYWIKRGYTESEAKVKVAERQSTFSKKTCIKKYGLKKGLEIFNDRQNRWQRTLKNKPDYEIDTINNKKGQTLENYIKRNLTINDYCLYRIKSGSNKIIINKTKQYIIDNKLEQTTNTFNHHYNNFLYLSNKKRGKASKESYKLFIPLYKFCRKLGLKREDIMVGILGSKELCLRNKNNTRGRFFFDFAVLPYKIIIEYNRYEFHPDPDIMSKKEIVNFKMPYGTNVTNKIQHEKLKVKTAKAAGFKIFKFWSHLDFFSQYDNIINIIHEKHCQEHK